MWQQLRFFKTSGSFVFVGLNLYVMSLRSLGLVNGGSINLGEIWA